MNAVLSKIELIVEGSIPVEIARQWANHGIIVYFEGLLSTSGKERGMLEDTHTALGVVATHSVRLCDKDSFHEEQLEHDLETFGSSVPLPGADVYLRGREVLILLPPEAFQALPPFLQANVLLKIIPVLFTQVCAFCHDCFA